MCYFSYNSSSCNKLKFFTFYKINDLLMIIIISIE